MRARWAFGAAVVVMPLLGQVEELSVRVRSALAEVQSQVRITILVPTKFPFRDSDIKLASGGADKGGYWVALHYSKDAANASYAAGFGGSTEILDFSGDDPVRLTVGIVARFRPVSCGGSCAPANLWWTRDGVQYHIQIKLRSDTPEAEQRRVLVEAANSMAPIRLN